MSIQSKLNSLKPYVQAMRFVEDFPIIDATFKKEWKVPSGNTIKVIEENKKGGNNDFIAYNFFSENKNVGFDELLEYVSEVINLNIEREQKQELFKVKNLELKQVFLSKDNSYNDLVNLEFVITSREDKSDEKLDFSNELEEAKIPEVKKVKKIEKVEHVEKFEPIGLIEHPEVIEKKVTKPLVVTEGDDDEPPLATTDQQKFVMD